jgi:hypothetical protein
MSSLPLGALLDAGVLRLAVAACATGDAGLLAGVGFVHAEATCTTRSWILTPDLSAHRAGVSALWFGVLGLSDLGGGEVIALGLPVLQVAGNLG